ncbi:hypothetical protein BKA64DRAFT_649339 [Cadophora sp. MPI-SDFR-AT-0126]|nr:hypothetical protein BKA64DRAFT_649339 [Leotiomycetes sp. MPI-SDFR-AT-0126]
MRVQVQAKDSIQQGHEFLIFDICSRGPTKPRNVYYLSNFHIHIVAAPPLVLIGRSMGGVVVIAWLIFRWGGGKNRETVAIINSRREGSSWASAAAGRVQSQSISKFWSTLASVQAWFLLAR